MISALYICRVLTQMPLTSADTKKNNIKFICIRDPIQFEYGVKTMSTTLTLRHVKLTNILSLKLQEVEKVIYIFWHVPNSQKQLYAVCSANSASACRHNSTKGICRSNLVRYCHSNAMWSAMFAEPQFQYSRELKLTQHTKYITFSWMHNNIRSILKFDK